MLGCFYHIRRASEIKINFRFLKEDAMEIQSPWVRAGKTGDRYPLAEYLGVSPKQAEKIRRALKGKEHHIGRVVIFAKADVDEYINTHCV